MNIALRAAANPPAPCVSEPASLAARPLVELIDDLSAAERAWRILEAGNALATPFQRFEWVSVWQRHVGAAEGCAPLIVLGQDTDGAPRFLLPFVYRPAARLVVAEFPGGAHASLNLGVWRRDAMDIAPDALSRILRDAGRARGIDLFRLRRQPPHWRGVENPFARLPRQPAADDVYRVAFPLGDGKTAVKEIVSSPMRKRLRNRERKLERLPGYRYLRAATQGDVDRILEAFFAQKATHLTAQGVADVFAEPGVAEFIRAGSAAGLAEGAPLIELHAIESGDEVLAMMSGVVHNGRFSCMFNSYTTGESGRWSPGLVLVTHVLPHLVDRGLADFDLGAGYAAYKSVFCREAEGLSDAFVPVSWRGRAAAPVFGALASAKRRIKANPALWGFAQGLRRRLAR